MTPHTGLTFTRRNAIFLGVCLGFLTVLVTIGIGPIISQQSSLDHEFSTVAARLSEQKQVLNEIAMVDSILSQLDQQPTPMAVTKNPLPQDKTNQITDDFRAIASEISLTVKEIHPLLDNKTDWNSLSVQAECGGKLDTLRLLMIKLLSLPYVRQIDRIEIHPGGSNLRFTLNYTIDLA